VKKSIWILLVLTASLALVPSRTLAQDALQDHVAFDAGAAHTAREKNLGHATSRQLGQDLVVVRGRSDLGDNARHAAELYSPAATRVRFAYRQIDDNR
jgi:hypothetical protein